MGTHFRSLIILSLVTTFALAEEVPLRKHPIRDRVVEAAQNTKGLVVDTTKKTVQKVVQVAQKAKEKIAPSYDFVMSALGDSLSTAANADAFCVNSFCLTPGHKRFNILPFVHKPLSWSTGTSKEINSHYRRLQKIMTETVLPVPEAFHGRTSDALPMQAQDLVRKYNPGYVTILIGGNDLCEWYETKQDQYDKFRKNLRTAFTTLVSKNKQVKILVSSLPNLRTLYQVGVEAKCQAKWNRFSFCNPLFSTKRTPEDRAEFFQRQDELNRILEDVTEEFSEVGIATRFAKQTQQVKFEASDLSDIDCFHPDIQGQNKLAEATWQNDWF